MESIVVFLLKVGDLLGGFTLIFVVLRESVGMRSLRFQGYFGVW